MPNKLIYRLDSEARGKSVEWKNEEQGVKILFIKGNGTLTASLVTFDGNKFTRDLSKRWLANRVAQYCLNSYISDLTPYESALLGALIAHDPAFKAMADKWMGSPALEKDIAPVSALRINNPVWELQAKARRRILTK